MALSLKDILAAQDLSIEKVEIPEWGGEVFLRVMSGLERGRFFKALTGLEGAAEKDAVGKAMLVLFCLCDQRGELLCDDPVSMASQFAEKSGSALTQLDLVASRINRLRAKDFEELAKN